MHKNTLSPLKSDLVRKRKISSINAYIWNLGKWYWWTYLQGGNTDTEAENGLVDTAEKGEGGTNWENSIDINALPCVKQIASETLLNSTRSSAQCSEGWDRGGVGRSLKRAEIHVYLTADSHCRKAETNATLQRNYPPIKNNFKKSLKGEK